MDLAKYKKIFLYYKKLNHFNKVLLKKKLSLRFHNLRLQTFLHNWIKIKIAFLHC